MRQAAIVAFLFSGSLAVAAQNIPTLGDTTAPAPTQPGHALIHGPHETVNPANGQVSLRFDVPLPPGRGLTPRFSIAYDSAGAYFPTSFPTGYHIVLGSESNLLASNGWRYSAPVLTYDTYQVEPDDLTICDVTGDYIFSDPGGGRHQAQITITGWAQRPVDLNDYCDTGDGGRGPISQVTSDAEPDGWQATTAAIQDKPGYGMYQAQSVVMTSPDGTAYSFVNSNSASLGEMAATVTDRNGNRITYQPQGDWNGFTISDTLGRVALSVSSFDHGTDTISVSGMTSSYSALWGASVQGSALTLTGAGTTPCTNTTASPIAPGNVITSLQTPEGTYTFSYDSNSGLLNKIQYPNGGYVQYAWALTSGPWEGGDFEQPGNPPGTPDECTAVYNQPVITDRYVSSDGVNTAEHQHFDYSVTWDSGASGYLWLTKQTTVTSTDAVTGSTFTTIYKYLPKYSPTDRHRPLELASQIPVESEVTTEDSAGHPLQDVTETWQDGYPYLVTDRQTSRNSIAVGEQTFTYASGQLTREQQFDGFVSAGAPILRETDISYASFPGENIVDRPATIQFKHGPGILDAVTDNSYDSATPQPTGITVGRDPNYFPNAPHGNLTESLRWLDNGDRVIGPGDTWSETTFDFDDTGQIVSLTDPRSNVTAFSYADNFADGGAPGATNAYLTQITPPDTPGCPQGVHCHVQTFSYFYQSGSMAGATDANGNRTAFQFNDLGGWGRLSAVLYPDGGETDYNYTTATLETIKRITSGRSVRELDSFDGLGRVNLVSRDNAAGSHDRVETCFDGIGNVRYTTYAFASASEDEPAPCSQPGDSFLHDALSRVVQITHADGSAAITTYDGRATETVDEGNGTAPVTKISQTNGLGELVAVCEVTNVAGTIPNSTPSDCRQQAQAGWGEPLDVDATGFLTEYLRGPLGHLAAIRQAGLSTREFAFDTLSELMGTSNPETGSVAYTYDYASNLLSETRANGVVVNFDYDALNRPVSRTFTVNGVADPADTVTLSYDTDPTGITTTGAYGHLTRVTNGSPVALSFSQYDSMGRAAALDTIVAGTDYHASAQFDNLGFPTYEVLPSGRTLWLDDDAEGRTSWIHDAGADYTYLHYRDYQPWGAPADAGLGNGVYQSWSYDARMRPITVAAYLPGSSWSNWFMDLDIGYNPDSTVASLTDELGSWNQDLLFSYDPLNRLSAWANKNGVNCPFNVDRFGNLTDTGGNPSCGMLTGKQANAQNQIAGSVYDASGQPLSDSAGTSYSWNVEGLLSGFQQTGQPAFGYVYDGLGRRVEKLQNGVVTALYLRDAQGELVSELDGTQFTDNILSPGDGARIASVVGSGVGTIYYYHDGPLGTPRAITTAAGANLMSCSQHSGQPNGSMLTYSPFGAEVGGCDQTAQPYKFTGKYRDAESSLDDFGARFYQSNLGRFLSPDWSATPDTVPYANFGDPQSLNLYSYARNNPTTLTDPDGHLPGAGYTGGACKIDGTDNGCGEPDVNGGGTVETDYPAMPDVFVPHGWLYPPSAPPQPQTPDAAHQSAGQQAAVLAAYSVTCSHSKAGCTPDQAVKVRYVGFTFNVQIQGVPLDPATLGPNSWNDPKLFSTLFHGDPSVYLASGLALLGPDIGHVVAHTNGLEGHIDHWGPWNPIHWGEAVLSTFINTRRGAGGGVSETCSPAGGCH